MSSADASIKRDGTTGTYAETPNSDSNAPKEPTKDAPTPTSPGLVADPADLSRFIQWFPVLMYIILYVAMDVVIASQGKVNPKTGKKEYPYTPAALVFLSELGKLIITLICLCVQYFYLNENSDWNRKKRAERGVESSQSNAAYANLNGDGGAPASANPADNAADRFDSAFMMPFYPYGLVFSVPAFIYMLWNLINYESLLLVSLSVYSVIYQTGIFFSAGLWVFVMKKPLATMQWVSLIFLSAGVLLVHIKPNFEFDVHISALLVVLQAFLSAVAGVANEKLYKDDKQLTASIHQQNVYFYSWGCIFTFLFLLMTEGPAMFDPAVFFRGFNGVTVVIICLSVALGLSVALILKHCNVIIKLFGQSVHSPLEVIAAHIFLGTELTIMILFASVLIAFASIMYKKPDLFENVDCCKPETPTEDGTAAEKASLVSSKA